MYQFAFLALALLALSSCRTVVYDDYGSAGYYQPAPQVVYAPRYYGPPPRYYGPPPGRGWGHHHRHH